MRCLIKNTMLLLVALGLSLGGFAQKVQFEASSPTIVATNEPFRIEFSLNAAPESFTGPTFGGFDVLAGPTLSQGQSVSIINGKVNQSVSYTYTYVLQVKSAGKYNIPPGIAKVDGKNYTSNSLLIEVVEGEGMGSQQSAPKENSPKSGTQAQPSGQFSPNDLLIRVSVNRNQVYKGQPIKATFKLYTRVPIGGLEGATYPAFNGFWTQELSVDGYKWRQESYNGRVYDARVIKEILLYPQQSGKLYIEQTSLSVNVQMVHEKKGPNSLMDDFFGGGPQVQNVVKEIHAAPIQITVNELPGGAPETFTGAVGKFKISGEIEQKTIGANTSASYVLRVTGNGNLPLIQAPKVLLPNSFEQYNIKTSENLNYSGEGITGYRQFDYPFIPRAEGDYSLDPVEFTYFDPEIVKYITLTTEGQSLQILPDSTGGAGGDRAIVSGISKEDLKILDWDIRFIYTGKPNFEKQGYLFFGGWSYWLILALLSAMAIGLYYYLRKYLEEQQNVTLVRNKRANKVALSRLKAAAGFMERGDEQPFFEEMLKALWGYMGDKLNIPVAHLTKENIREELLKREVSSDQIEQFIHVITACEYAQYSPSTSGQMGEVYKTAVKILSKFESQIKKRAA